MLGMLKSLVLAVLAVVALWVTARILIPAPNVLAVRMAEAENAVLSAVLPPLLAVAVFEVAVIVSAVLDWREARLQLRGWRHAWAVAHATVFARAWRRTCWTVTGLRHAWAQRHAQPVIVVDPPYHTADVSEPFPGTVIDAPPVEERKSA